MKFYTIVLAVVVSALAVRAQVTLDDDSPSNSTEADTAAAGSSDNGDSNIDTEAAQTGSCSRGKHCACIDAEGYGMDGPTTACCEQYNGYIDAYSAWQTLPPYGTCFWFNGYPPRSTFRSCCIAQGASDQACVLN